MGRLIILLFIIPGCFSSSGDLRDLAVSDAPDPVSINQVSDLPPKITLSRQGQKIVRLKPGSQPGLELTGQSNITYLADEGVVEFTSQIKLGNTKNIKFDGKYGFRYTGKDYSVFSSGLGNNVGDTIRKFDFGNTATTVFDAMTKIFVAPGQWLTFNGKPETTVFWGLSVDSFKLSGKTALFQGPWEANPTYHMISAGITFTNGTIINDGSGENEKIRSNSLYGLKVDHLSVTGPTIESNRDIGIILVIGSGQIRHVYRDGGYGYLERMVMVKLDNLPFDQTCGMYNCVDLNSTRYGTVDIRMEKNQLNSNASIPLRAGDFYFVDNVSGDKKGNGTYVTNAIILGSLQDDQNKTWTIHIKNNVAYGAMITTMSNGSSLVKNNSNGIVVIDSSNNIDVPPGKPLPKGILDKSFRRIK